MRLSLLDLAVVAPGTSVRETLATTTALARKADSLDRFERLWFAEHHNMPAIASAATSVLIGHIAAHTDRIRVGAGGVMLPNHSPLVIAEQFGTLAELHGDRIDLGLGRAPGTDQRTLLALRRDARASDQFPQDVQELQGYLSDESLVPGINATPGRGTRVPLYILGSSLFGAQLAAALGLPYAFASHFAPDALDQALKVYRERFEPSEQLDAPYAIVACNVVANDDESLAQQHFTDELLRRIRMFVPGGAKLSDEQARSLLDEMPGLQAKHMASCSAVGDAAAVGEWLAAFAERTQADELMCTNLGPDLPTRQRALEILAEAA